MEILPETTIDGSDCSMQEESMGAEAIPGQAQSGTLFDVVIARWKEHRKGARIPELTSTGWTDDALPNGRTIQIIWREGIVDQVVTYLGGELAREFGISAQDVWSGSREQGALAALLYKVSSRAIRLELPVDLTEQIVSGRGIARNYRILALPFSVANAPDHFVIIIVDWTDAGIRYTDGYYEVEEDGALILGDSVIPPDDEDVLLLKQELEPGGTPRPSGRKNPNPPYFVVSVAEQQKLDQSRYSSAITDNLVSYNQVLAGIQAKARSSTAAPSEVLELGASQEAEPLLLTEVIEPAGQPPVQETDELLLKNIPDLVSSLEAARDHASAAMTSEERSHTALYGAIGAAHDFALCAAEDPEQYQIMLDAAGLKVQPRAPFTPIVKLVFGAAYDRTRLAEYATALAHARRVGIPSGCLTDYLAAFDGGLKALVRLERQQRRHGAPAAQSRLEGIKDRLREAQVQRFDTLDTGDDEFVLVLARRLPGGEIAMVGKVPEDETLLARAARAFLAK